MIGAKSGVATNVPAGERWLGLPAMPAREFLRITAAQRRTAPRPFLVSGGSEDPPSRWIALNHLVEVNRVLGYRDRVAMTTRPDHRPNAESNAALYTFFERFLKRASLEEIS